MKLSALTVYRIDKLSAISLVNFQKKSHEQTLVKAGDRTRTDGNQLGKLTSILSI